MEEYNTITNCIRPTYNTMYFMTSPKLSINLLNGFNGILKLHDFFQDFHECGNPEGGEQTCLLRSLNSLSDLSVASCRKRSFCSMSELCSLTADSNWLSWRWVAINTDYQASTHLDSPSTGA